MLWNSCPYTIYPTFSSLPTLSHISPSTNSSLRWTDTRTFPHSPQTPHSPRWNPVPFLDVSSLFHLSCHDLFHSSTGPSVCWSPFHISYVFLFRFCSCSASTTQHLCSILFLLSVSHHFLISFSHWLSDVEAYPESYLELQFLLHSVLYNTSQYLSCSLASSTQFSLVFSLPRFALRPSLEAFPQLEWLS